MGHSRVLPWEALSAGWRPGAAPPDCGCSGRSHRAPQWASSVAYPRTRHDGYTATAGYTSACPGHTQPLRIGDSLKQPNDEDTGWSCPVWLPGLYPPKPVEWKPLRERLSCKCPLTPMMAGDIQMTSPVSPPFSISSHTSRVTQQIHSLVQHQPSEVDKTHILCVAHSFAA